MNPSGCRTSEFQFSRWLAHGTRHKGQGTRDDDLPRQLPQIDRSPLSAAPSIHSVLLCTAQHTGLRPQQAACGSFHPWNPILPQPSSHPVPAPPDGSGLCRQISRDADHSLPSRGNQTQIRVSRPTRDAAVETSPSRREQRCQPSPPLENCSVLCTTLLPVLTAARPNRGWLSA